MIRIVNQSKFLYLCQSSDWQCIVESEDEETAATTAVEIALGFKDKDLNMSMFVAVKRIHNNLFEDFEEPETKLFYSPIILANAGYHSEAAFLNEKLKTDFDELNEK